MDPLGRLIRKEIVVNTTDGITYRGVLIEANEEFLEMMGETGWISVQMEKITSVRGKGDAPVQVSSSSGMDSSFYNDTRFDPPSKK
jgi:hypothetical protein